MFGKDDLVDDLGNLNTIQQCVYMYMKKQRRPIFVFIQAVLPVRNIPDRDMLPGLIKVHR
jgi:hypothetical protein